MSIEDGGSCGGTFLVFYILSEIKSTPYQINKNVDRFTCSARHLRASRTRPFMFVPQPAQKIKVIPRESVDSRSTSQRRLHSLFEAANNIVFPRRITSHLVDDKWCSSQNAGKSVVRYLGGMG